MSNVDAERRPRVDQDAIEGLPRWLRLLGSGWPGAWRKTGYPSLKDLLRGAADEIERLRARVAEMEEAARQGTANAVAECNREYDNGFSAGHYSGIETAARWCEERARLHRARAEALNPETHFLTAKELDALAAADEDDAEAIRKLKEKPNVER